MKSSSLEVASPTEENARYSHIDAYRSDAGYSGFLKYFEFVTKFRPTVTALSEGLPGKSLLRMCDVSHPCTPEQATLAARDALEAFVDEKLGGDLLEGVKFSSHQPLQIRESVASILDARFTSEIGVDETLVLSGSSTQWIDVVVGKAISRSLHNDHIRTGGRPRMPVVLAPAGSFKCGGYFPYANGGKLVYIPTALEDNYKLTAENLKRTITAVEEDGNEVVCCFLLETPTALGQNFSQSELEAIAAVLSEHPEILWVQDGYHLGTEHSGISNPFLGDIPAVREQGCTIFSFRRDWGGAAAYANVSAFHSFNPSIVENLSHSYSQTYFYSRAPFSGFQEVAATAIANEMCTSDIGSDWGSSFSSELEYLNRQILRVNEKVNTALGTEEKEYLFTIPIEAGQFGFVFFDAEFLATAGILSSSMLGELMCLHDKCRVIPTLLEPMGIGKDPIGIRINAIRSFSPVENRQILDDCLERLFALLIAVGRKEISYENFRGLIERINSCPEVLDAEDIRSLASEFAQGA